MGCLPKRLPVRLFASLAAMVLLQAGNGLAAEAQVVRIASWNLGGLSQSADEKTALAMELLAESADILALQECPEPSTSPAAEQGWQGVYEYSNAILSRWPILRSGLVAANPAWPRDLPWADIQPPNGPVFRVYSAHLTFKRGGIPFLTQARAIEARRILIHASSFEGPVILAGDLNTVGWIFGGQESEPAIQLIEASGYTDALFTIGGRTQGLLGRLDWIFSRGFQSAEPVLGDYAGSDHRWILARLVVGDAGVVPQRISGSFPIGAVLAVTVLALLGGAVWRRRRTRHVPN